MTLLIGLVCLSVVCLSVVGLPVAGIFGLWTLGTIVSSFEDEAEKRQ